MLLYPNAENSCAKLHILFWSLKSLAVVQVSEKASARQIDLRILLKAKIFLPPLLAVASTSLPTALADVASVTDAASKLLRGR